MNNPDVIERIKASFCGLTSFKIRKNALEVITAYSTLNSKFVSVFITFTKDKIVLTDNGWIDLNYYDTPNYEDSEFLINRVKHSFQSSYNVKSTIDKEGVCYYYKSCDNIDQIPSLVFDLANFIVGVVNSYCVQFKDEKEEKERETFRKDASGFLKVNYSDKVRLRGALDDFNTIKFNAIITKGSDLYLFTFITGSTQSYFENDLRKSIVNHEITLKSKYRPYIRERLAIVNDSSDGYQPQKSSIIFELLREKTTREPIKWSEKEQILELI
jgi:hypothetical protein